MAAVLSSEAVAGAPAALEGIGFCQEKPSQTLIAVVKADDAGRKIVIEGYGESLEKPVITRTIPWPPKQFPGHPLSREDGSRSWSLRKSRNSSVTLKPEPL